MSLAASAQVPMARNKVLRAALIDLDGTLVDTTGDFEQALAGMLRDLALPSVSRAEVVRHIGKGGEHLITQILAHVGVRAGAGGQDRGLFGQAWQRYQHHYGQVNGRFSHVYAGVLPGLAALQQAGVRMACITNKPVGFAQALLRAKGLAPYLELTFGGDSFERKKPHPMPLLKACEALSCQPAQALMVGDSVNDVQAARAAGCPVALMGYGFNHGEPASTAGADAVFDRLDALVGTLF